MAMKMTLCLILAATFVIVSSVPAKAYNRKIISYHKGVLQDARFLGDKFVSFICSKHSKDRNREMACTLYSMKRVDDKFENLKMCIVRVSPEHEMSALDPFGPDHVLFRLTLNEFVAVNLNDCRYVKSSSNGNYTEDLASIGADVEKVFSGSLQIFEKNSEGHILPGFDVQDAVYRQWSSLLNPQIREAKQTFLNNQRFKKTMEGFYMYDRYNGLRQFQDDSSKSLFLFGKSNNLISNIRCDNATVNLDCDGVNRRNNIDCNRTSVHLSCDVNQSDLNGKLKLTYKNLNLSVSENPISLYNWPGGGFLLLTIKFNNKLLLDGNLIKVDANGYLIARTKFLELDLHDGQPITDLSLYRNDNNEDCVSYGKDLISSKHLYIYVQCNGVKSLSHNLYILVMFLIISMYASN